MKLYVLENSEGGYYDTAFRSKEFTEKVKVEIASFTNWDFKIIELEFQTIGKYLYYIRGYYGFEYDAVNSSSLHDIIRRSKIYNSKYILKQDPLWLDALQKVKEAPDWYIVKDRLIAGDVGTIDKIPFTFGKYEDGNFNLYIERIKIDIK